MNMRDEWDKGNGQRIVVFEVRLRQPNLFLGSYNNTGQWVSKPKIIIGSSFLDSDHNHKSLEKN